MSSPACSIDLESYKLHACLPFVELASETVIRLGPVIFWSASNAKDLLNSDDNIHFQHYIHSIAQIKARRGEEASDFVDTVRLNPEGTTCISIHKDIPAEEQEFVLIEALYLVYFACFFRNLYFGNEVVSFNSLRKIIPASSEFIAVKDNWKDLHIKEASREEILCIHAADPEIFSALGQALANVFLPSACIDSQVIQESKKIIRSIRYFIDRFFQRFVNLFEKGLTFPEELFEAEDLIFLSTSFETLFNIDEKSPAADFKHKLRPLLHLKYGSPVEVFWKWVDDFYDVRHRLILGDTILNPMFYVNPNFEISHLSLGIKLFVYSVCYKLCRYQLMKSFHQDQYTPPDFKWIHPEETLIFFWTEANLLRKLSLFILQVQQTEQLQQKSELYAEIGLLSKLFVKFFEDYYERKYETTIRYIPIPLHELRDYGNQILKLLDHEKAGSPLEETLHPHFRADLEQRLQI